MNVSNDSLGKIKSLIDEGKFSCLKDLCERIRQAYGGAPSSSWLCMNCESEIDEEWCVTCHSKDYSIPVSPFSREDMNSLHAFSQSIADTMKDITE